MTAGPGPRRSVGPPVTTSAAVPNGVRVHLTISADAGNPIDLGPDVLARLFAAGLSRPEPDRTGWVTLGELEFADEVAFRIGCTPVEAGFALHAIERGIEWVLRNTGDRLAEEVERHHVEEASDEQPADP